MSVLGWSVEEMKSYVKLPKFLASKSKNKTSGVSKAPSSPRPVTLVISSPVAPVVSFSLADVDNKISSQFASFLESFDRKLELLSHSLL